MPFTPFHFGPGAAIKAAMPKHFSFTVFCFAQVATDCETAYYLYQGVYPWHRFFHTYVGAAVVGAFSLFVGRPLCQLALRLLLGSRDAPVISFRSALSGAFIGTYSHVFIDSIVHEDVRPFMPFSAANSLYYAGSESTIHVTCVVLGILGTLVLAVRSRKA